MLMVRAMNLNSWRIKNGKTLAWLATELGIDSGKNPSRRIQRIERGEVPIDVVLAEKIVAVTSGEVTLRDLASMRREASGTEAAA